MKKFITKIFPFESFVKKKYSATNCTAIVGFANVFNVLDEVGDKIFPEAFHDSLSKHNSNDSMPLMYFEHEKPIEGGKWLKVYKSSYGLWVEGYIVNSLVNQNLVSLINSGKIKGLSVGFFLEDFRTSGNGVREILKGDLVEISLVENPANIKSGFQVLSHKNNDLKKHGIFDQRDKNIIF